MEHTAKFEELSLPVIERRRPVRRKSYLRGLTVACDGTWARVCTVRNISERGACLKVQTTAGIPAVFDFVIAGQPVRTCKTIWRDETQIGVMFIQSE